MKLLLIMLLMQTGFTADNELARGLSESRELFTAGKRLEAVAVIDKLIAMQKNKKTLQQLADKRKLYLEQFITTESFQGYQAARVFSLAERWSDCVKQLEKITESDKNSVLVMMLNAGCRKSLGNAVEAEVLLQKLLALMPGEDRVLIELGEIYLSQGKFELAQDTLRKLSTDTRASSERYVIASARILAAQDKVKEAIEVLKTDHENRIDHILVIFELGELYLKKGANDWMARKYYTLFQSRCKRVSAEEQKSSGLEKKCLETTERISEIDKRVGAT